MAKSSAAVRASFKEVQSLLWSGSYSRRSNYSKIDEVYPGIYIGGLEAAMDVDLLAQRGITHILNSAYEEFGDFFAGVKTNPEYYKSRNFDCEFKGVAALDEDSFDLYPFFEESADFIEKALSSNGKVLVHCFMGISRSATLVICYMMIKKQMLAADAVKLILSKRGICPNDGFIQQLCELEDRLIKDAIIKVPK